MNNLFLELVLEGHPVPKGRPRFARHGNFISTYTPNKTAVYERELAIMASNQMEGQILECAVRLEVEAIFNTPKQRKPNQQPRADVDNLLKIVGDGLNKIVWKDDRQITSALVTKKYGDKPLLIVRIFTAN